MSKNPQHGRRRAQPAHKESLALQLWNAAPKPTAAGQRMAAVAVAGALLVGAGLAEAPGEQATAAGLNTPLSADEALVDAPVAADSSVAVSFTRPAVASSSANTTNVPDIKGNASSVVPVGANGGAVNDPAGAQAFAASKLADFGWGQDQMKCLIPLWNRESDWTTTAENSSSLAYGIAQSLPASKMDSVGTDWRTNYQTQITWGMGYIKNRYGNPCGAWGHETSIGWY
ncbi:transglycosylase [Pseudarthrobacter sp. P1]|uniref:aggregation-promoting factor C-terminal-like domain-containing protein n=1 Tax=Pseudarthrobacter sp. P1 TaxID=3418418 RepID=UPI003CF80FBE